MTNPRRRPGPTRPTISLSLLILVGDGRTPYVGPPLVPVWKGSGPTDSTRVGCGRVVRDNGGPTARLGSRGTGSDTGWGRERGFVERHRGPRSVSLPDSDRRRYQEGGLSRGGRDRHL